MWHRLAVSASRLPGVLAAVAVAAGVTTAAGPAGAQDGLTSLGTVGALLRQMEDLQGSGALEALPREVPSRLDSSRRQGADSARRLLPPTEIEAAVSELRLRTGQLTPEQRIIVRRYCNGELPPEEARNIDLIEAFSRLERDYCLRSREVLLQYGYDTFFQAIRPEALGTGAIPPDYVLGVGDELVVTFYGQDNNTFISRVDREGRLLIPQWAPIAAAGRSFGSLRREIEARTATSRLNTEVFIALGAIRNVTVSVVGEVREPGLMQLTALSSIVDAISLAGGIRKTGSVRRIHIQRGDKIFWLDAYDLLYSGVAMHDLRLFDGDRIIVPAIGATVAVNGDVKRPAIYELPDGRDSMTVGEAVDLAGGSLRPQGVKFMHLTFDETGSERLIEHTDPNRIVRGGDILLVTRRQDIQLGGVEIDGHVRVPGRRSLASAETLASLVGSPNTFRPDPYLLFSVLQTTDPQTRARRFFPVNLFDILDGKQDYRLRDGDRLIVLSAEDIRYLSSQDVQDIVRRGIESEQIRRDVRRGDEEDDRQLGENQSAQGVEGTASGGSLSTLQRFLAGANATSEQPAREQQADRQPDDEQRQVLDARADICQGLKDLAAIVATTSSGRFAGAVRTIETADGLAEGKRRECPEIFDRFGDLLPLALEHVVAVNGEVRRPGAYPVVGEAPVASIIAVAGGLAREVDLTRVEVSRYTPDSIRGAADTSRGLVNLASLGADNVAVGPGDVIRFNPVFTDRDTGPVLLVGEFVRTGLYEIRRGERLSEVIARAGGLTAQAYPYGAIFTRERVKREQELGFQRAARELNSALAVAAVQRGVNPTAVLALQDLSGRLQSVEALGRVVIEADPTVLQVKPELDVVLEPGDRIFVPKRPNFVTVIGDVLNPSAVQFRAGATADRYIRQAGGYQASADEDRVFVVYPNGEAEPLALSPWNFNPVQIPPGSTIVVPKDPVPLDLITIVREGASLVSQLAVTAASLAVISRD